MENLKVLVHLFQGKQQVKKEIIKKSKKDWDFFPFKINKGNEDQLLKNTTELTDKLLVRNRQASRWTQIIGDITLETVTWNNDRQNTETLSKGEVRLQHWLFKSIWVSACDFQQCGFLTCIDSEEPLQPPFKLRNSKWCSVSSLTIIDYSSD